MGRRASRLLLISALLYGTGAHWIALQGVAWGGMLLSRAADAGWSEAVSTTFSGAKPCDMCVIVEKGRDAEQSPESVPPSRSVHFAVNTFESSRSSLVSETVPSILDAVARAPRARPSSPPPKPSLVA